MTSPNGKDEECAKFTIDTVTDPFLLSKIAKPGQTYTFGAWIKADAECNLVVGETAFPITTEWTKHHTVFESAGEDVALIFGSTGTYYIYHPQLELGNMSTDWTPAPEDVDQDILDVEDRTNKTISEKETSILATTESVILSALESYVETGDYEDFRQTVESQLSVMADEISMNFTTTTENVAEVDGELKTLMETLSMHFEFSVEGLTIRTNEGAMSLTLENDMIVFKKNGQQFGWWDGVDFHTGNIMVEVNERAQFGNFAFVPRSDGSLSFLKVR